MKAIIFSLFILLFCGVTLTQTVEGKWTTTIETENGPYTFNAEYAVNGDSITGRLYSVDGSVRIYNGKINGDEFEYNFELNYSVIKHEGKLVDGNLEMKTSSDGDEWEFTMTPLKDE